MPRISPERAEQRRAWGISPVGYVYFIQAGPAGGPIKIGWTLEVERRLAMLQCGNHLPLYIVATIEATEQRERQIHKELDEFRLRGEWFTDSTDVREFMRKIGATGRADRVAVPRENRGVHIRCEDCGGPLKPNAVNPVCRPCRLEAARRAA